MENYLSKVNIASLKFSLFSPLEFQWYRHERFPLCDFCPLSNVCWCSILDDFITSIFQSTNSFISFILTLLNQSIQFKNKHLWRPWVLYMMPYSFEGNMKCTYIWVYNVLIIPNIFFSEFLLGASFSIFYSFLSTSLCRNYMSSG